LEIDVVHDAITNGWGEKCYDYIKKFENKFSEYTQSPYSVATSSCTGALHLGLAALNITEGDEVIVPNTTWIASISPILYLGATPVFVDISEDDWCIDPSALKAAITNKTKAILIVHLYGNTAKVNEIIQIAREYGLYVIEDAAEALGAKIGNHHVGTLGDFGVFSFHGTKMLTTGEGGMLITHSPELYERVLQLNNHGRARGDHKQFWSEILGYKYKISNIQAALGFAQMSRVEELLARKREIFISYQEKLSHLDIQMNLEKTSCKNSYWMPTVVFSKYQISSKKIFSDFSKNGIEGRHTFWPISTFPFLKKEVHTPISLAFSDFGINLPSFHDISESEIQYVVDIFTKSLLDK
jgi:perosamine synthetase